MLSSTYIQVVMQVENDCFRQGVAWLESQSEKVLQQGKAEHGNLDNLFQVVSTFRQTCCSRRVERHFLPELRKWAGRDGRQMAERDALHRFSAALHVSVCRLLEQQIAGEKNSGKLLQKYIGEYCHAMIQMLGEEERLVFSLARKYFSHENWIYLAGIFMQEESGSDGLPVIQAPDMPNDGQIYQTSVWPGSVAGNWSDAFQYA